MAFIVKSLRGKELLTKFLRGQFCWNVVGALDGVLFRELLYRRRCNWGWNMRWRFHWKVRATVSQFSIRWWLSHARQAKLHRCEIHSFSQFLTFLLECDRKLAGSLLVSLGLLDTVFSGSVTRCILVYLLALAELRRHRWLWFTAFVLVASGVVRVLHYSEW